MSRLRRFNIALISAVVAGLWTGSAMAWLLDDPPAAADHFDAARHVPADVTLYLHVEEAATIRRELANRPIAVWFNETFAAGEAGRVWSQVAKAAGVDSGALFDAMLGRRMTFVLRTNDQQNEQRQHEWALVTEVAADAAERALVALDPVALGPKARMAMVELPEHELLIARRGDLLVIGPRENKRLFMQMLRAAGGEDRHEKSLAAALANDAGGMRLAGNRKEAPAAEVYVAHNPPLGGRSVAVATFDLHRDIDAKSPNVLVRHFGSFDASPFTRGMTRSGIDCRILDVFDEGALLAIVEPNDAGRSTLELFLHATVGETLLSQKMRQNLGERRIVVLGEIPQRDASKSPAAVPSLAVCYEAKQAAGALDDLDRQMVALARRLNPSQPGEAAPAPPGFAPNRPRSLEAPAVKQFVEEASLNWVVVEGRESASSKRVSGWYVVSSHADQLDAIVSALSRAGEDGPKPVGSDVSERCGETKRAKLGGANGGRSEGAVRAHSAGLVHGRGLAHFLRAAPDLPLLMGDAAQQDEVRESLRILSDLMLGLEHVRWRLARPSEKEIDLEVRIRLAE